jgi:non-ribosomal peptide synthetase component F
LYTDAIFQLLFGASVTAGSAAQSVPLWILEAADGTNYASPSSAAAGPPSLVAGTYAAVASVAITVIVIRDLVIRPVKFKLMLLNNLGAAFNATTTASFFRFGLQG